MTESEHFARLDKNRALAVQQAVKLRDMEWWEALALVDNVAPTPEAVKEWIVAVRELAVAEEREACAKVAEEGMGTYYEIASSRAMAKAIRERGK